MLKFYHATEDSFVKKVRRQLDEMVVAHKVISADRTTSLPDHIPEEELPALSDGHEIWTSQEEINRFLQELKSDLTFSRSITSDACYPDPDNPDKCL